MPQFRVPIEGEGLKRVWEALHRTAGIHTLGPAMDTRFASEPPEQGRMGHRMTAVVDADSAISAEARVRDALPDGEYVVGQAEQYRD